MSIATRGKSLAMRVNAKVNGEPVTVRNAAGTTLAENATAVRGQTEWTAERPRSGVTLSEVSADFILQASLVTGEPTRGWTIETAAGEVFRVMPFGPQNQLWSWHDREGQTYYRIHTKERS